jgi:hypothetical protein
VDLMLRALALGDGRCVYDDAIAALAMFNPDATGATNNIGCDWEDRVDYWATLHPSKCPNWLGIVAAVDKRVKRGRNRPQVWGHKKAPGVDRWTQDWRGSTGLLLVKVLIEEGFERIVLAGIPMSREAGHYYDNVRPWLQFERYHGGWTRNAHLLSPYVRSMSGWTRELLGPPTSEWLGAQLSPPLCEDTAGFRGEGHTPKGEGPERNEHEAQG